MGLVRDCDTRATAYCILGGVKETFAQLSRERRTDIDRLVEEILRFGLSGVARPELLETLRASAIGSWRRRIFFAPTRLTCQSQKPNSRRRRVAFYDLDGTLVGR